MYLLIAGYNAFTMHMVQGHYLGDRRASQEERYAFFSLASISQLKNNVDKDKGYLSMRTRAMESGSYPTTSQLSEQSTHHHLDQKL
jgi:hypothetical protein